METGIKNQIDDLIHNVRDFVRCIDSLPNPLFLKKIDEWTPRDITAHFIGWNTYTVKGCLQLMKGELPFYFINADQDFRKINSLSVIRYGSEDKQTLLNQLADSLKDLRKFLTAVGTDEWEKDTGVRRQGGILTIKNTTNALISEYILHRKQIEQWLEKVTEG